MYDIFTQLGVGVASILALVFICDKCLKHISKDREQCNDIIVNHLSSHAKTNLKLENSIEKLTEASENTLRWFAQNGK